MCHYSRIFTKKVFLFFFYTGIRWHGGTNDDYDIYFNDLYSATNVPPLVFASNIFVFWE